MAYDEELALRVRGVLAHEDVREIKMFGGLAVMLRGHMCCGVIGDSLLVRVGRDGYAPALVRPHTRVMDFTGRPLSGFVLVGPEGVASDADLAAWVRQGAAYAASLGPKEVRSPRRAKRKD